MASSPHWSQAIKHSTEQATACSGTVSVISAPSMHAEAATARRVHVHMRCAPWCMYAQLHGNFSWHYTGWHEPCWVYLS